jgi:hypothetical protein
VSGGVSFNIMTSLLIKVIIIKMISIYLFAFNANKFLEYNLLL